MASGRGFQKGETSLNFDLPLSYQVQSPGGRTKEKTPRSDYGMEGESVVQGRVKKGSGVGEEEFSPQAGLHLKYGTRRAALRSRTEKQKGDKLSYRSLRRELTGGHQSNTRRAANRKRNNLY